MTDQHPLPRRQSAVQALAAVPDETSPHAPARPSRSRVPKPPAAPPARPAARSAGAAPARAAPDAAPEGPAAAPASAAGPEPDDVAAPAPVSAPAARPRAAAKPTPSQDAALPDDAARDDAARDAAARDAAARDDAAPTLGVPGSPSAAPGSTTVEVARPPRRAAPGAMPEPADAAAPAAAPAPRGGDATEAAPAEEAEAEAAPADGPDAELADPEADEPDAPARDEEEDEDDEEEEAPRSNARMPGMGGGMARPGMRPISPQLGGRPTPAPRIPSKAENFVEGDHVVYPTHGVGRVERIATEEIAGHKLELIHITFEENRMTLRVPVAKARSAGLRKLATRKMFDEALAVLRGRARIKRTMWSRRAQEYEAKINSGDPLSIAEVVRDLHRNAGQPDQSFSERQIYEAAMDRLAAELAALDQTEKSVAATKLVDYLKTV